MKKIILIHSLNNYTGSTNILSIVAKELMQRGHKAQIVTSRSDGFLSGINEADYRFTCYRWCNNIAVTMFLLLMSQIGLFFRCLLGSRKHIYYINTVIPFGAIVGCRLSGKQFVIHVHEDMQQRKPLYLFLKWIYKRCNRKSIFVSDSLRKQAVNCRNGIVVANALPDDFFREADRYLSHPIMSNKNILMVASLRRFKGIYEFAELARRLPNYSFELVLSASDAQVRNFEAEIGVTPNLALYSQQTDLHPFYQRAKIVLQLSNPKQWVETFGLTILEAMAYGIPTIVPNVGGPAELIEDGVTGYTVDPLNVPSVQEKIELLMTVSQLYDNFSQEAIRQSKRYTSEKMITKIENYII